MGVPIFAFVTDCYRNHTGKVWNWTISMNATGVIASGVAESEPQARNAIADHLIALKVAADQAGKRAANVAKSVNN